MLARAMAKAVGSKERAVTMVSEKEAAALFSRLEEAVATGRGIANALQKIVDTQDDHGEIVSSHMQKLFSSNTALFVALLMSSLDNTLRCALTLQVISAVHRDPEELVSFADALCKTIVAQSTITNIAVINERYEEDFKGLMPAKLGGSDAWRHVFEYTEHHAPELLTLATTLSSEILSALVLMHPVQDLLSPDVVRALVPFLQLHDNMGTLLGGSELLAFASKSDDLEIKRILVDSGACAWGVTVMAEYSIVTTPSRVLFSTFRILYQLSEAIGLIFPDDAEGSVSDDARACMQGKIVDAGLAEALAHALDELAPTLLYEGGLDDEFKAIVVGFSLLFTVVGIICPTFLAQFQAAPVTARGAAFDVLAFVITVVMMDAGDDKEFWQLIFFKLLAVIEENAATSGALNLAGGVAPGLFVDGEWVEMWNYGGADEGEGEGEDEDEDEDDEAALAGEGEAAIGVNL